jgi:tetratricopeptide (TPR) repeat protein
MRYFLIGLFVLLIGPVAFGQKKTKTDPEYMVYKKAMNYGDLPVARTAVMQLMVKYPGKSQWKDTLIAIYGAMGMYEQAILLGEEILQTKPNDTNTLQVVAISYEGLNVLNKAIEYYEKVLALRNNMFLRYKLAVCQYGLKRNPESMANVDKILSEKTAAEQKITITYEQGSQEVPLLAAALNLGGIILIDEHKYEDAKLYFESALKLDQTFALAQNNLQVVVGIIEKGK